jgi:hypothetical protein
MLEVEEAGLAVAMKLMHAERCTVDSIHAVTLHTAAEGARVVRFAVFAKRERYGQPNGPMWAAHGIRIISPKGDLRRALEDVADFEQELWEQPRGEPACV